MKKVSAILLFSLFLFNMLGYRLVFDYMQQKSDTQLTSLLDKQEYNDADLITIKVPLSLPYMNNQKNFERVNGEITIGDKILKYVKRKVSDGNLILLCLPDNNQMLLVSAKTEFFKNTNDLVQNNQPKKSDNSKAGVFKFLSAEYDAAVNEYVNHLYGYLHSYSVESSLHFLPFPLLALPEQPPEFI